MPHRHRNVFRLFGFFIFSLILPSATWLGRLAILMRRMSLVMMSVSLLARLPCLCLLVLVAPRERAGKHQRFIGAFSSWLHMALNHQIIEKWLHQSHQIDSLIMSILHRCRIWRNAARQRPNKSWLHLVEEEDASRAELLGRLDSPKKTPETMAGDIRAMNKIFSLISGWFKFSARSKTTSGTIDNGNKSRYYAGKVIDSPSERPANTQASPRQATTIEMQSERRNLLFKFRKLRKRNNFSFIPTEPAEPAGLCAYHIARHFEDTAAACIWSGLGFLFARRYRFVFKLKFSLIFLRQFSESLDKASRLDLCNDIACRAAESRENFHSCYTN